jgi:epoxyqueuosine reductase
VQVDDLSAHLLTLVQLERQAERLVARARDRAREQRPPRGRVHPHDPVDRDGTHAFDSPPAVERAGDAMPRRRLYGCDVAQDVCSWNITFSAELPNDSPHAPRAVLADKDARQLVRDLLSMTQPEFSAAFEDSPMKRATPRGLTRNAAVVLGSIASSADVPALVAVRSDDEPLARGHAARALGRVGSPATVEPLRARLRDEPNARVRSEIESALQAVAR